jgi:hypothetical protein
LGEHQLDKLGVTGSSPVPPIPRNTCSEAGSVRFRRVLVRAEDAASLLRRYRMGGGVK